MISEIILFANVYMELQLNFIGRIKKSTTIGIIQGYLLLLI